jgi:hypothetical protein
MQLSNALWQNKFYLEGMFSTAIVTALRDAWTRSRQLNTQPQEPDFVASLVLEGTPLIYQSLAVSIASYGLSVSVFGVFCHQSPLIRFTQTGTRGCELGDMLIAFSHKQLNGTVIRNALLLQAKATALQPHRIGANEMNQLNLYETWPTFKYSRPGVLKGQQRDVTPKTPHGGGQYLLIDNRPPEDPLSGLSGFPKTFPAGCCMPAQVLYIHSDFASVLFNLLTFTSGRPFFAQARSIDWSQVVWDLIQTSVSKAFNRKNSGRRAAPRHAGLPIQVSDGLFLARSMPRGPMSIVSEVIGQAGADELYRAEDDGPPVPSLAPVLEPEEDGAVSVILIETSENER